MFSEEGESSMNMKKVNTLFLILFSFFLLASCGKKVGDHEAYLGGTVKETKDQIIIEGESNLIPGSRVNGEVYVNEDEIFSDTTEIVDDKGRFLMELEHHQYGDAEVVVTFDFTNVQEEEVLRHYGENGEKLEGPFVYIDQDWGDKFKKAMVTLPIQAEDETTTHEFTTPDWDDPPEDYGDPRVWIEVDEITEDDQYFYVKGRTNLVEGSLLSGYYSDRWGVTDETRVNPDGTFELKIEYKYSDDPYFTIKFSPYSQWESVTKVYGQDGEKLVGNLVEPDGSSQHIEAIIEYNHD